MFDQALQPVKTGGDGGAAVRPGGGGSGSKACGWFAGDDGEFLGNPIVRGGEDFEPGGGDQFLEDGQEKMGGVIGHEKHESVAPAVRNLDHEQAARSELFPPGSEEGGRLGNVLERVDHGDHVELAREVVRTASIESLDPRNRLHDGTGMIVDFVAGERPCRQRGRDGAQSGAISTPDVEQAARRRQRQLAFQTLDQPRGARQGRAGHGVKDALFDPAALVVDGISLVDGASVRCPLRGDDGLGRAAVGTATQFPTRWPWLAIGSHPVAGGILRKEREGGGTAEVTGGHEWEERRRRSLYSKKMKS